MTICGFHTGNAGNDCERCGATWAGHVAKTKGLTYRCVTCVGHREPCPNCKRESAFDEAVEHFAK